MRENNDRAEYMFMRRNLLARSERELLFLLFTIAYRVREIQKNRTVLFFRKDHAEKKLQLYDGY
jgi:hypothetical protein